MPGCIRYNPMQQKTCVVRLCVCLFVWLVGWLVGWVGWLVGLNGTSTQILHIVPNATILAKIKDSEVVTLFKLQTTFLKVINDCA